MHTLNQLVTANNDRMLNQGSMDRKDDQSSHFPRPRYFQVHFQHLHERNDQLQQELAQLKDHLAFMDSKLERVLALLNAPSNAER